MPTLRFAHQIWNRILHTAFGVFAYGLNTLWISTNYQKEISDADVRIDAIKWIMRVLLEIYEITYRASPCQFI